MTACQRGFLQPEGPEAAFLSGTLSSPRAGHGLSRSHSRARSGSHPHLARDTTRGASGHPPESTVPLHRGEGRGERKWDGVQGATSAQASYTISSGRSQLVTSPRTRPQAAGRSQGPNERDGGVAPTSPSSSPGLADSRSASFRSTTTQLAPSLSPAPAARAGGLATSDQRISW